MTNPRLHKISTQPKKFTVNNSHISLEQFISIVDKTLFPALSGTLLKRLDAQASKLKKYATTSTVYGYNTGFGPMAGIKISPKESSALQLNLIRSHALGLGDPLDERAVRAIMTARMLSISSGLSGVYAKIPQTLCSMIEHNIIPVVPEHGSVGASGDLVQLAHVGLAAIGEGEVLECSTRIPTLAAFKKKSIKPATLEGRDGLALINGTSAMTALAALVSHRLERITDTAITLSALLFEVINAPDEYLDSRIHAVRPHPGQTAVASSIRNILSKSKARSGSIDRTHSTEQQPLQSVQHQYSIRCTPQVLGPIVDTFTNFKNVVVTELNSVTDNPIFSENGDVLHGGNFHGDYISLECDKVRIAISKFANLSERRIALLLDSNRNGGRAPFLNTGKIGLNLGLQGLQFVATSTSATIHALATPLSPKGVSTNGDNQDVISVGTDSAIATRRAADQLTIILTIEAIALARAASTIPTKSLSPKTREIVTRIHAHILSEQEDTMTSSSIERLRVALFGNI